MINRSWLFGAVLLASGCAYYRPVAVSTGVVGSEYEMPTAIGTGVSKRYYVFPLFYLIPFGNDSMERAWKLALSKTGGDALSNVVVERRVKYVLPLFIQTQTTVTGTVVKYTTPDGQVKRKRTEDWSFGGLMQQAMEQHRNADWIEEKKEDPEK